MQNEKRTSEGLRQYKEFLKENERQCTFCLLKDNNEIAGKIKTEFKHFYIIKNKFPYLTWENREVIDHLLLIPKKHFIGMDEMDIEMQSELIKIIAIYEKNKYSLYEKCLVKGIRTVPHWHMHLIKVKQVSINKTKSQ